MSVMLWTRRHRALLRMLLAVGLWAALGAPAEAAKRKKPPQVQQDPLETESNPPPPPPPPPEDPEPTVKPGPDKDGGSSGSAGRSTHSSGGSSSSGQGGSGPPADKAGPFMFNVKIGPAFCLYLSTSNTCAHQGSIVLDLGAALTRNRNGYLILPVQFQFQPGASAIIVPVGFQYDVRLPFRGFYVYPRIVAGYAALLTDGQPGTPQTVVHSGVLIPEFGLKYILNGRWNLGGEVFSLPLFFNASGAQLYYRVHLSAGVTF
mgnify:CR=1 FL=1